MSTHLQILNIFNCKEVKNKSDRSMIKVYSCKKFLYYYYDQLLHKGTYVLNEVNCNKINEAER